jgi:hypothetical protein
MAIVPQQAPVSAPAAESRTWRQRYVQGSFRGVAFVTEQRQQSGGRRIALFELPFRDTPVGEDLGRRAREAQIDCFVIGADYMDRRDALVDALEAFGPGTFVDPWTGEQTQVYADDYQLTESTDEGGMARFTIAFRESGAEKPMSASVDTAALSQATALQLTDGLPSEFSNRFSIDKAASFVEDAASDLVGAVAIAAELSAASSGGLGQALRSFESGLRLLPGGTSALLRWARRSSAWSLPSPRFRPSLEPGCGRSNRSRALAAGSTPFPGRRRRARGKRTIRTPSFISSARPPAPSLFRPRRRSAGPTRPMQSRSAIASPRSSMPTPSPRPTPARMREPRLSTHFARRLPAISARAAPASRAVTAIRPARPSLPWSSPSGSTDLAA